MATDSTAQSFVVRVLVYDSVASAQTAYDYAPAADATGQLWDITPDATVAVPQAEQSTSAQYTTLGGAVSATVLTIYSRAGEPAGAVGDLGGGIAGNIRQFLLNSPTSPTG